MALWFAVKEWLMIRRNSGFIEMLQMIMILWAVKIEAARLCWCVEEWWRGDHCQRSGQPNHSILCGLHRHWATHRRCCQEPGGTQSREHSFLIANSEANMFACDSEHYGIVWLCLWGLFFALLCLFSNLPKIGSDVCAFRGSASPWAILRSSTPSVWLAASLRTLSCRLISSCGLSSVLLVKVTSRWSSSTPRGRQGDQRFPDMNVDTCRYEYLVISQYLNLIFCPICFQAWSFTYCIPQVHKCHISTHAWYQASTASCDKLTIHTFHFPFCAGEEVPPRGNLFHDSVEDEGDSRGILGFQNQRCSGTHLRSRKTTTSVHCEAFATAHVVRAGSSSNFSAILLNLLQMGKSVAVRNHTSSDVSMLSQHIQ